jgi:hypothetical protein
MPLAERMGTLLTAVKQGNPPLSTWLRVADDHVLDGAEQSVPFTANGHYFVLRVHQAYLAAARQWFARYDPMLFALTEYTTYDGGRTREPFLVSPDTFRRDGHPAPAGMSFTDVRATGLRPYRGNTIDVTVILYRNKVSDAARQLLSIAEHCLVIPQLAAAAPYLSIAETGLEALESVLGLADTIPLLGIWKCFDPLDGFQPGWFVMCESSALEPAEIWVRGNRLLRGKDPARLSEVAGTDFLLCSLGQASVRNDAEQLEPFGMMWQPVRRFAGMGNDKAWEVAKALMTALQLALDESPDLIPSQASELISKYKRAMKGVRDEALDTGTLLGPRQQAQDPLLLSLAETLTG